MIATPRGTPPPRPTPEAEPSRGRRPGPPTAPVAVPGPRRPVDTRRTTSGRSVDGRQWELLTDPTSVTAVTRRGTVAEAHVSELDEQVVVEFWADGPDLPEELSAQLVRQAFSLPAVRPHRRVLVCVPQQNGAVLAEARQCVEGAWTRTAGVTCLLEGRIGDSPSAQPTAPAPTSRR